MVHKLNIRVFLAAKKTWLWYSYTFWCHLTYSYRFFWYHKNWWFYLCLLLNFQKNAKIQSLIKAPNFWNISKFNKSMTNLNIFCKENAHWVLQKQKNAKWKINLCTVWAILLDCVFCLKENIEISHTFVEFWYISKIGGFYQALNFSIFLKIQQ
jgi:hypothetical protein